MIFKQEHLDKNNQTFAPLFEKGNLQDMCQAIRSVQDMYFLARLVQIKKPKFSSKVYEAIADLMLN